MFTESVVLPSPRGDLAGIWYSGAGSLGHTLITSHGLLSHKGTSKYRLLAETFVGAGLSVFSFDFSGCGESRGDLKESTVGSRILDLDQVYQYVLSLLEVRSISLLGSSMGGFVSLHVASKYREAITSTILWASPWDLSYFLEDDSYSFPQLGQPFYKELQEGDTGRGPSGVERVLIIHGLKDTVVPVSQARENYRRCKAPKHLEIMEGAHHRFSNLEDRKRAAQLSLEWVLRFCQD